MSWSPSVRKWLQLPSRIALLIGFGALSTAGAKAEATRPVRVPQQSAKTFGALRIWTDAGRIYAAEPGKYAEEIQLGDTAEARYLRELLERDGATANSPRVLSDRMILVGGGGSGFDWAPNPSRDRTPEAPGGRAATGFRSVAPGAHPPATPPANSQPSARTSPRAPEKS